MFTIEVNVAPQEKPQFFKVFASCIKPNGCVHAFLQDDMQHQHRTILNDDGTGLCTCHSDVWCDHLTATELAAQSGKIKHVEEAPVVLAAPGRLVGAGFSYFERGCPMR